MLKLQKLRLLLPRQFKKQLQQNQLPRRLQPLSQLKKQLQQNQLLRRLQPLRQYPLLKVAVEMELEVTVPTLKKPELEWPSFRQIWMLTSKKSKTIDLLKSQLKKVLTVTTPRHNCKVS